MACLSGILSLIYHLGFDLNFILKETISFFQSHPSPFYSLLSRLFSTIGTSGKTPPGFLDGEIHTIYKEGGDPLSCGSYRPITLLNTDYRICAKILASRMGPALATIIGPEQTAFLPGRLMGDNITLLQLLPEALHRNHDSGVTDLATSGVIAFLDF